MSSKGKEMEDDLDCDWTTTIRTSAGQGEGCGEGGKDGE